MEKGKEKTGIEVVIDTNIIISALIPKYSKLRELLLSGKVHSYAPEYLLKELDKFWRYNMANMNRNQSRCKIEFSHGSGRKRTNSFIE